MIEMKNNFALLFINSFSGEGLRRKAGLQVYSDEDYDDYYFKRETIFLFEY